MIVVMRPYKAVMLFPITTAVPTYKRIIIMLKLIRRIKKINLLCCTRNQEERYLNYALGAYLRLYIYIYILR